jgi:hypothetical protein
MQSMWCSGIMISKSDKVTHHGYQRYYRRFFAETPPKPTILEIGVDNGNSLELWSEFLTEPKLYAIDIINKTVPEWVTFDCVDQSDAAQLSTYAEGKHQLFDVIVDDGSHVPEHQILTLNALWQCLKPGGSYIVEDIETCYWKRSQIYGYQFDARIVRNNIVKLLPSVIEHINSEFMTKKGACEAAEGPFHDVDMVIVGSNCVCFVKKNLEAYGEFYDRPYRIAGAIDCMRPTQRLKNFVKAKISSFRG